MEKAIIEEIKKYNYIGARGLCSDENYQVGDVARNSRDWDFENDCSADYELNGTSTIDIPIHDAGGEKEEITMIENAINTARGYGKRVVILGSNSGDYGDDPEEIVLESAVVIAVL